MTCRRPTAMPAGPAASVEPTNGYALSLRIADIARILSLSQKTAANYQSLIKQKLDADTSAQTVWIALKRGLVGNAAD